MTHNLSKQEKNKIFKQKLQRVHATTGISFSLLMYMALFFGIFAILLPFIQVWEKPSRHFKAADITKIDYSSMIDPVISDPDFPKNNIIITLPGYQHDPVLKISHQFVEPIIFNPNNSQKLENEGDQSQLASFLNTMHYGGPLKSFGYTVFGFMAVAVMFLVIGGLVQVITIKYKDNGKNNQSKFSKWHRKIFTWLFPPFIIITLTGAMMNIGFIGSKPMTYITSKGESSEIWRYVGPVLYPQIAHIERTNESSTMLPISELIKKAQKINPNVDFQKLTLINWKDSSARVKIEGYNPYMPFLNGISNRPSITLSAKDGSLIEDKRVLDKHWSSLVYDSIYFLHLLFGVDTATRLLISLLMLASTFALGFGVLLYLEKKSRKFPKKIPIYNWMGKLSLSVMVGVIPSTGLLFLLQWILPFDLQDRFIWQKGLFFIFWLSTLMWSFYRLESYKAAKEFLLLGAIFFILAPLAHFYGSGFSPESLYKEEMYEILSVDIGLFLFGIILFIISKILPKNREQIEIFWKKRL
ncbi:PepSY-associated TM helix domain-containing protein [Halarcobacter ebronensis]|uniref:ABC transporter permease n=1 Tax=Halarcobacter ebronensis TaxID=1462615 RepID=A0A4Q1AP14_9BACT|nr:PepSY-associated TM helix domain-containing protein [Halarcobacter ebronensis]QKF81017.1 PepSY domain-containing membrane protein [Halarcobacter ebronensis]RXK06330.1 ABC transporter permease [Halarcobacter ebronensis]